MFIKKCIIVETQGFLKKKIFFLIFFHFSPQAFMALDNGTWNIFIFNLTTHVLLIHFVSVESPLVVKVIPVWLLWTSGIKSISC